MIIAKSSKAPASYKHKAMLEGITLSCAADTELAKDICDYLCSKAGSVSEEAEGGKAIVIGEFVSLTEDEIQSDQKSQLTKKAIRLVLESFIRSHSERMKGYEIVESGDVFIVAVVIKPLKLNELLTCEFCGYFTPYEEDLFIHKKMHYVS